MEAVRETERCLEKIRQGLHQKESQELEQLRQRQAEAEQELEELQRKREERRRLRGEEEQRREEEERRRLAREEVPLHVGLGDGISSIVVQGGMEFLLSSRLTVAALAVRRRSAG